MKLSCSSIGIHFLVFALTAGIFGCATRVGQQGMLKKEDDYRKTLELQKQKDSMNAEEEITKKIPQMTAEEYERLGDNYIRQGNIGMAFIQYTGYSFRHQPGQYTFASGCLLLIKGLTDDAMKEFEEILK